MDNLKRLQDFVDDLIKLADWPEYSDIDGIDFQDLLIKYKLLLAKTVHEPCGEWCKCSEYYLLEEFEKGAECLYRPTWDEWCMLEVEK